MVDITDSPGVFGSVLRPEITDVALGGNETNFPGRQLSELAKRDRYLMDQVEALGTALAGLSSAIVGVNRGGFGADNSARAASQIPYTIATGDFGWLMTTEYGRSLLNQSSALEASQALNLGLGKLEFAVNSDQVTTTSDVFQNVNLNVTITPQSAESKFLLLSVMSMRIVQNSGNNATAFMTVFRGAVPGGVELGQKRFAGQFNNAITLMALSSPQVVAAVDSPNTTDPVTYRAAIRNVGTGETTFNFSASSILLCLEILPTT